MKLYQMAVLVGGTTFLLWSEMVTAEPWDSSCRSQISDLESTIGDALRAQQEVADAYEEYEQKREDLRSCLLFPDIYDLFRDGCSSYRWDTETARNELQGAMDTFYRHLRTLVDGVNFTTRACR